MTDLENRIKKVIDAECFEQFLKPCPMRRANETKVYDCWQCHRFDALAVRLAEEVRTK